MQSIAKAVPVYQKISTKDRYTLRKIEREKGGRFALLDGPSNTVRRVEMSVFKKQYKKMKSPKRPHPKGCGLDAIFLLVCSFQELL